MASVTSQHEENLKIYFLKLEPRVMHFIVQPMHTNYKSLDY